MSADMLAAALDYIARGMAPIPVPFRKKGPVFDDWQSLRISAETAPRYFNGEPKNIGVILGEASGGLVDVDLDCIEATRAAPYLLPRTALFGHASKPASHYVYRSNLSATQDRGAQKFIGSDKIGLLELRMGAGGRGAQTVFPPSVHVSGEPIVWEGGGAGKIAEVDGEELFKHTRRLAAATELARNYPKVGARHDSAHILGGFLGRCGFSPAEAALFVEAVAAASLQPVDKRRDMARTARDGAEAGKRAGFPLLAETFGKEPAKKVAAWLDYRGGVDSDGRPPGGDEAPPPNDAAPPIGDLVVEPEAAKPNFRSLKAFIAEFRPISYAVDKLMREGSLYTFTGRTGEGKTAFLVILALALGLGRGELIGRKVKKGRVAFCTAENPDDLRMRLMIACFVLNIDLDVIDRDIVISDNRVTPEAITEWIKASEVEFTLIIVDTWQAYFDGKDLNNPTEAVSFTRRFRPLANLAGAPVVIIAAHPNKKAPDDQLVPNGAGSVLNEVDGNFTMLRDETGLHRFYWLGKIRACRSSRCISRSTTSTARTWSRPRACGF